MSQASISAIPVVVLVSGSGTLLQAVIEATKDPQYGIRIAAVGADRAGIEGLQRAEAVGIPTFVCPTHSHRSRLDWDVALAEHITRHLPAEGSGDLAADERPRWVLSAGFMKVLGPAVLATCAVLNTHPALLPSFPGAHAVVDALTYGVAVTGATVHLVDAGVDTGPIVAQRAVPVRRGDDEASLHERIKVVERDLLVRSAHQIITQGFARTDRKVTLA